MENQPSQNSTSVPTANTPLKPQQTEKTKPKKHITVKAVVAWFFSIVFIIYFIILLLLQEWLISAILALMALIVFPPLHKFLNEKYNFRISAPLKVILVIIGIIASFAILISAGYREAEQQVEQQILETQSKNAEETNEVQHETTVESEKTMDEESEEILEAEEEAPSYKVGDEIRHEDMILTIQSVEDRGKKISETDCGSYCSYIMADGKFILLLITIKNDAKNPRDVYVPKLYDSEDREFQRTSTYIDIAEGYQNLSYDRLNPGNERSYYIIYDVPEDASGFVWRMESAFLEELEYEVDLGL